MASFLAVTNWRQYQHYRDRTPIWVKFYVEILHDEKLKQLPLSTRLLWDQMLLLAATFQNAVPNSPELIGNLTGIPPELCAEGIEQLVKGRWLREKQTRRSTSKPASAEKEEKKSKKENHARVKALLESAEKFVRDQAYFHDNAFLKTKLESEYGIDNEMTMRRLMALADAAREAA